MPRCWWMLGYGFLHLESPNVPVCGAWVRLFQSVQLPQDVLKFKATPSHLPRMPCAFSLADSPDIL